MGPSSFLEASKMGDLARVQELVGQCTDFNRGEALLRAALGGRLPVVRFLVEECAVDVEFTTENGVTALMWAASSGNVEVVRYLAEQEGANVNATSQNGYTAFVVAAGFGYTEVVHYLAKECGADVHARDEDGSTALLLTAANGHIDTARYLVEHCGLAVDGKNTNGYTALMGAARENHLNLVQYLAGQCGAHVDASNGGGSTALMEAGAHGSVEVVRYLAGQCNADVDARNDVGASALMWAAATGELQVVRCLAQECGADVNAKTKDGNTALVVAGQNDRIDIVRCLVEQCGADLSVQNNEGMSALNLAAQRGKLELVRYLVEYSGEDTNVKDEALMWSARSGSIDVVQHLIEHCGADVRSEDGARAVIFAASHGNIEVMRYLVDQCGADVNAKDKFGGSTALMWAADNGMMQAVQYLVEQGSVDVNTRSEMGITALMRAAASGNIQVVRYLVEHCGADAEAKTNTGDTALMWAAEDGRNDVVRYLFENCGVDVNVQNENGDTALMRAAANGKIRVVRYLAAHCGAGVNDRNEEGDTALMKAAAKGNTEMVRYLAEECGADVSIKNEKGNTALISAVEYEHIEVARFLAEQCPADVNASNEYGITALMWAARHGYCDLVQYFVEECEAQVNVKDGEGKTVLMWAAKSGKVKVVRYFVGQCDAQVNTMSNDGKTALRMAADYGYHEIQRILTPFLLPASHTSDSNETAGTVVTMSSYGIPASEIELTLFNRNGNIGGEFRAKWLDADVVVKLFIPDASHSSFKAEILLWQRLRHPNVIKMYGACEASPHLQFFVCEFASNGSLLDHVKVHPEGKANTWKHLYEAALCLEYLHERGILHGDLRCSNILIGSDGLAKLSNFGLSGPMKRPSSGTPALIGSRRWQAPEVLEGEIASYASDVYSLGISILEAVNGTTPWGGGDDSADNWSARFNKKHWTPETDGDSSWYAPDCPAGDARELVWRMCCQDPRKRASLSAVVRELERLAITESSEHSQPEHDPADMVHEYESGKVAGLWLKLVERKAKVNDDQYGRVFDDLERIHDCLQESTRNSTLVARFQSLLSEFYETIKMPPKQARMMRLSSTRATATSFYSVQWRIESLMASLGLREFEDSSGREARWQRQQQEDVEYFVSGVSDTFLLLQELKTAEERSAFLRNLQTEMENPEGKYTSDQLEVVRNAYEKIAGGLETDDTSKVTPEWFIPWYELVVDEWNCLGEGGFGSVYRAKWLDSDVVVKRVKLAGSDFKLGASTTIDPSWLTSEDPSDSQAEVDANKRAETVAIFRREVEIWFSLSHPHVVRLFGACHVGRPFFVCEYATHGTLVSFLRKHPGEIWTKLHESALGVQYLHARGVVHGDLKGNNIVIGSDMKAKVTDFGLSSVASGEDKTLVSGAWNWVAPELLDTNKRPTFATDVYSLGMCIVEALRVVEAVEAGKDSSHCLPWRVGDRAAVKYHATHGTVPSRPAICEDSQWELVVRMCVLEADERIKISTVVDELARLAYMSTTTSQAVELAGISISGAVTWESIPEVTAQAQGLLASLEEDGHQPDATISLYMSLWGSLGQIHRRINDGQGDAYRSAFCSLVAASRESTTQLQNRKGDIVSLAQTTMRCYALQRRLDKLCEAYFLVGGHHANV